MKRILINFVLDKSGSMQVVQDATISGFNEYIETLKRQNDVEYYLSLTTFDTSFNKVCGGQQLYRFEGLNKDNYKPDGSTALYDAIISTLNDTDIWLRDEKNKYTKDYQVLCVVMTDGQENSSRQYNRQQVLDRIREKEGTGYWTFAYLGANQDSWAVGTSIGVYASSTQNWNSTPLGTQVAYTNLTTATQGYSRLSRKSTDKFFDEDSGNIITVPNANNSNS